MRRKEEEVLQATKTSQAHEVKVRTISRSAFSPARLPLPFRDPALSHKLTCERSPDCCSDDGGDALELGVVAFESEDFLGGVVAAACCYSGGRRRLSSCRFSSSSSCSSAAPALLLGMQHSVLFLFLPRDGARESGEGLGSGVGVVVLR